MLDGQGGQVGVRNQRSACLPLGHHIAQYLPMPFAGVEESDCGAFKPAGDDSHSFVQGRTVSAKSGVGAHTQESEHRRPGQPYWFLAGKAVFEPAAGRWMVVRTGIVSIKKEVGVYDNHR